MFDVGFAEIFLLSILGLLVLGPERLPAVARTLGGFVRKARMSYANLKRTVEAELAAAEARKPLDEARQELESVRQQVRELSDSLDRKIDSSQDGGEPESAPAPTIEPPAESPAGDSAAPGEPKPAP